MFAALFRAPAVTPSSSLASCTFPPVPNTGVNDGNEASSGPGPADGGILDSRGFVGDGLVHENDCPRAGTTGDWQDPSSKQSLARC